MAGLSDRNGARLRTLARLVREGRRILLLTHEYPDGDAFGSMVGLGLAISSPDRRVTMFCAGGPPALFKFLPGAAEVRDDPGRTEDYDLAVMLDCHRLERVGGPAEALRRLRTLAALDHHLADELLPENVLVATEASSTGELVFYLINELGVTLTREVAANLFAAISTDTGSFCFENTSAESLEIAARLVRAGVSPWEVFRGLSLGRPRGRLALLGLALSGLEYYHQGRLGVMTLTQENLAATGVGWDDADGFVEYPRSVQGVELAVLFRSIGPESCQVSLRSLGRINAAALARMFGGGGHSQAAGFTANGRLSDLKAKVIEASAAFMPPLEARGAEW
ncbi:MAG: bifunctional oligoribonuclease/PAP phosphatase NrnA [Thermodesulfobacteriota bacterium]